jgi:hypothetical protein
MNLGYAEQRTHDDVRHGATSLFAAPDIKTGAVIGKTFRKHRAAVFQTFLPPSNKPLPSVSARMTCSTTTARTRLGLYSATAIGAIVLSAGRGDPDVLLRFIMHVRSSSQRRSRPGRTGQPRQLTLDHARRRTGRELDPSATRP